MKLVQPTSLAIVVGILLVSGVAKVLSPAVGAFLSENWQILLGSLEVVVAAAIAAPSRYRAMLVWLCAIGAFAGVGFHLFLASRGAACGCLGTLGPRGLGPALAGGLGAASCLWLSFRFAPELRAPAVS
jgi:hypothetical protein